MSEWCIESETGPCAPASNTHVRFKMTDRNIEIKQEENPNRMDRKSVALCGRHACLWQMCANYGALPPSCGVFTQLKIFAGH